MSAFSKIVSVTSASYPDQLHPHVVVPFEPNSVLISLLGDGDVCVSFSDGIKDDGKLVAGTELRTQTWDIRSQGVWLRLATAGDAMDVLVEASEGPL